MMDVESIEKILVQCAKSGCDISYSEALQALGMQFTRPRMRQLCRMLCEVEARAKANGEPELAVLLVRGSDRLPGDGWWAGRTKFPGEWTGEEAEKYVRRLQRKAFKYWRSHTQQGTLAQNDIGAVRVRDHKPRARTTERVFDIAGRNATAASNPEGRVG